MKNYIALLENNEGEKVIFPIFDCPNLEDATIEASNKAEDIGMELLEVKLSK